MRKLLQKTGIVISLILLQQVLPAQKRLYIANDDHTDFILTRDSAQYVYGFVQMLDRWMYINDSTKAAKPDSSNLHSKWNCDGSYWISFYEKINDETTPEFAKLLNQIKAGQITVPYSPLVTAYGGVPVEGVLRGMYYAGKLERRFGIDLSMATAMENQTMPLGLSSLWKGSGAKYAWHGVCNCDSEMDPASFGNREKEIYWYKGLDTNKILMKWYKMKTPSPFGNRELGGYAEIFSDSTGSLPSHTNMSIDDLAAKASITETGPYPYKIAAAFGVGHDAFITTKDELVDAARAKTIPGVQTVIVSNEVDFFEDFENTYQPLNKIDTLTKTFGNEWDLNTASLSEVGARVKRAIEKLRAAEAMAAIEINFDGTFMAPVLEMRKEAWESIGLYWEHSMGFDNGTIVEREAFQRRLERDITAYADALFNLAKKSLSLRITKGTGSNERFYVFNPLGWMRSDYADFKFNIPAYSFKVVKVSNPALDVPYQFIQKNGDSYLRIFADSIPSVGYRTFEIVPNEAGTTFPNVGTIVSANTIQSDSFRITYTNSGVLTSVIDRRNGDRELVKAGKYINDLGAGNNPSGTSFVESNGPVSITIATTSNLPKSHTTRITLYKNIGRIEIDNKITDNLDNNALTWKYAFDITTPEVWHEEVGAIIKAKYTDNATSPGHYSRQNSRHDWSTLNHFASVNETAGNYGVSLSNQDCSFMKIGNSTVSTLDETSTSSELSVLAGGRISNIGFINQGGDNEFNQRFAITTHTTYSAAAEMKKALEHQNAMVCDTVISQVNFLLPEQFSFVSTNNPGTVIWSVKPAEDGPAEGVITRLWNLADIDAPQTLTYGLEFNSAYRSTHIETDIETLAVSPGSMTLPVNLGHNEMKTFRVKTQAVSLPIQNLIFSGYRAINSTTNELSWNNDNETTLLNYILERSTDGNSFSNLYSLEKSNGKYVYQDAKINTAYNYYYRIKIININGRHSYSNIVFIRADKEAANLLVFPNPATNILTASLVLSSRQRCNVSIINAAGQTVKTTVPPLFERGYNTYSVSISELPAGEYNLVISANGKKYVQPFIKR